ncbi:MAG TPA: hypothetical protein VF417_06860 [Candidatus Methylomirabilis sp.]
MLQWIKRGLRRVLRTLSNWTSLLAIPCGLVVGYNGHRTLGALLILGGTLAYFLVDPILMVLDLVRSGRPDPDRGGPPC